MTQPLSFDEIRSELRAALRHSIEDPQPGVYKIVDIGLPPMGPIALEAVNDWLTVHTSMLPQETE